MGIITQLVLSDPALAPDLGGRLEQLLNVQDKYGNWPSSLADPYKPHSLVHFCHGAPGFLSSLSAIRPHFPDLQTRIDEAVVAAERCVFDRGLLLNESCLCHGIAGNALALAPKSKEREHMLAHGTPEKLAKPCQDLSTGESWEWDPSSVPDGLWFGAPGRVWSWGVLAGHLPEGLPMYADVIA